MIVRIAVTGDEGAGSHGVYIVRCIAERSGRWRSPTKHHGLGVGDRACLVLAARLDVPAVTADRAWADLDIGVRVEVITRGSTSPDA